MKVALIISLAFVVKATANDNLAHLRGVVGEGDRQLIHNEMIVLGSCEDFAAMVGTTATCAGSFECEIIGGYLGVYPDTSVTGNFAGKIASKADSAGCAEDGLAAWKVGRAMKNEENNMLTELGGVMGGMTFAPGVYTHAKAISIALGNPVVTLDARGDENAVFIFNAGTTLTTCAKSNIVLSNGAKKENVYWVLGTSLDMGADSILVGNVLAGTAITMGTNAKILGRAIGQTAMTCETACTIETSSTRSSTCGSILPGDSDVTIQVDFVGSVPAKHTASGTYNMKVGEGFSDRLYFIDQKEALLYEYKDSGTVKKVFDFAETPITGLDITKTPLDFAGAEQYIHSVAPGKQGDEIYVVFTSKTLPEGLTTELTLPDPSIFQKIDPNDLELLLPPYWSKVYKVFYKFTVNEDGDLESPVPFFALEQSQSPGHLGGGILSLDDGRILWAVGDGLPYGTNGLESAQSPNEHLGKILLIDPATGTSEIVASGIRNSQQMNLVGDLVVFMDIGGVTAEEVNAIPLTDLLDTSVIENFGWGIHDGEDFGREGTFKVGPGIPLAYNNPPCLQELNQFEMKGFTSPWMQFGRGGDVPLFAISGSVVSDVSFSTCKLFFSEFNTGLGMCAFSDYDSSEVSPAYFVKLVDANGDILDDGLNTFVARYFEQNQRKVGESLRGDARAFRYPDGSAGVFIERTGEFFKLTEVEANA